MTYARRTRSDTYSGQASTSLPAHAEPRQLVCGLSCGRGPGNPFLVHVRCTLCCACALYSLLCMYVVLLLCVCCMISLFFGRVASSRLNGREGRVVNIYDKILCVRRRSMACRRHIVEGAQRKCHETTSTAQGRTSSGLPILVLGEPDTMQATRTSLAGVTADRLVGQTVHCPSKRQR